MADNNHPVSEPLKAGANAANATKNVAQTTARVAKSAAKLGKTIAATAKGAAAGSIWGAIAAFAWECKDVIVKIIIAASVILLIPVLIVCMLPGVIFDGLDEPYSVDNKNALVLNDSTILANNASRISESIGNVMSEAREDILSDIERDFKRSDADKKEVIDAYGSGISYSVSSFASQYSAYRSDNVGLISISDMESVLRDHKDKLFSYTKTLEERSAVVYEETTNEETGETVITEKEVTEKWAIYTVVYNGEEYFADNVFRLSDKQKQLAKDYSANLKLFFGEGQIS